MRALSLLMLVFVWASCSTSSSERPAQWMGEWSAQWETDPASFPDTDGITSYTMPGKITFDANKVNIQAYGFEGCVFSKDTLDHTLSWKVSNDSLILINEENAPGMIYQIKECSDDRIKLQLMEDIFLTLSK